MLKFPVDPLPGDSPPLPESQACVSGTDDAEAQPEDIVVLPIEDCLDLHSFRPGDIASVAEEYLQACFANGLREVRIIHGKGTGFQRDRIQHLLGRLDFVAGFHDAPAERGHWGATIVYLREKSPAGG